MKELLKISTFILAVLFTITAFADLSNKTYVKAKKAYSENKWQETINLLIEYKNFDSKYLEMKENKDKLSKINEVISFCQLKLPKPKKKGGKNVVLTVAAMKTKGAKPKPQPKLP